MKGLFGSWPHFGHKSMAAIKSVAKKYEAKLWQKLATTITL
jgi:hypothetical protein